MGKSVRPLHGEELVIPEEILVIVRNRAGRWDTYLREPLTITEAIPGFEYGTLEDFVRRELYAAEPAEAPAG